MTPSPQRPARPWTILGAVIVAGGLVALWIGLGSPLGDSDPAPARSERRDTAAAAPDAPGNARESPRPAASDATSGASAPAQRIPENGRLRVTREALREGDVLALGLGMPDEARGDGPRPVKVVGLDGHVLDATAVPVEGPGSGVRLEIDPQWLIPGRYMVQVETAEKRPLAVRRYVLEVIDSEEVEE